MSGKKCRENVGKIYRKTPPEVLLEGFSGDSHGIQTHNLLIRSQMLYSVELGSQVRVLLLGRSGEGSSLFLLDPGFLAGQASEVEDTCATYLTNLVDFDRVDEGGVERENTFHADTTRHLAYGESLGNTGAALLEHDAAEFLDTLLAFALCGILFNLVGDGDGVTGLEVGEVLFFLCHCLAGNFHQIHFLKFLIAEKSSVQRCWIVSDLFRKRLLLFRDCKSTNYFGTCNFFFKNLFKTDFSEAFGHVESWLRGIDGVPAEVVGDGRLVAAFVEISADGPAAEFRQVEIGLGVEALGNGDGDRPVLLAFQGAEGLAAERGFTADLADDGVAAAVALAQGGTVVEGAVADAVHLEIEVARVAVRRDHEEFHAVVLVGSGAGVVIESSARALLAHVILEIDLRLGVHDAEFSQGMVGEVGPVDLVDGVPFHRHFVEFRFDGLDGRLGGGESHLCYKNHHNCEFHCTKLGNSRDFIYICKMKL